MFKRQTKRNVRHEEGRGIAEQLEGALPCLAQLQDGYEGADLHALTVGSNQHGDGFMCIAKVHIKGPVATYWAERGYGPGWYVLWGHGDTVMGAIAGAEAELASGEAGLVEDKYPPDGPRERQKAPKRTQTHKGSKPYG